LFEKFEATAEKLARMEREVAVFRQVSAETSQQLECKIEELSVLRLITDTASQAMMSHDPFGPILDKVIAIVGADTGSLVLLNPETGRFEVCAFSSVRKAEADETMLGIVEKLANQVATVGEPCLISEAPPATTRGTRMEIGSLGAFPLTVEERTIGVLTVSSPHFSAFDAETERIMHIITGQIAIAVQNARLYGEVRKTKEYLENLVERAGDAIFTIDGSHRVVSWNRGAETIFGRPKGDVVGSSFYQLVSENEVCELRKRIEGVLESEQICTVETDAVFGDRQKTQIALTLSPIRGAKGDVVGVSGIARDITEGKRVEEELRQLNTAKTNFVSTVSHELRTPLTSIKSFTEILLHDMHSLSEEGVRRHLNIINEECDRLSGLISSLLDLQKLNAGKLEVRLEPVLLAQVVQQAANLFDSIALRDRIELSTEFHVPDGMTKVSGDRKRLMQIISNLLSNAFKYSDAGGHVTVGLICEDEGVRLTVTDNGIGIPESEKDKVFEKFYRVDNEAARTRGGTGLGLAITKELVALHGGRIWVDSHEGCGCCFNVWLPTTKGEPSPP
jgi:two-component system OmpR family sensor kinase